MQQILFDQNGAFIKIIIKDNVGTFYRPQDYLFFSNGHFLSPYDQGHYCKLFVDLETNSLEGVGGWGGIFKKVW